MRSTVVRSLCWAALFLLGAPPQAHAQGSRATAPDRTTSTYFSARAEAARIPLLERNIAVELEGGSLEQALAQIAARTGLRLTYSTDLLPSDQRISLHTSRITAADAVLRVLRGTSLDLLISPSGHAVLVECSPATCGPRHKHPGAQTAPATMSYVRVSHESAASHLRAAVWLQPEIGSLVSDRG
jgi:hypothetical protein